MILFHYIPLNIWFHYITTCITCIMREYYSHFNLIKSTFMVGIIITNHITNHITILFYRWNDFSSEKLSLASVQISECVRVRLTLCQRKVILIVNKENNSNNHQHKVNKRVVCPYNGMPQPTGKPQHRGRHFRRSWAVYLINPHVDNS